ncbi:hypothetical protein PAPHI01_0486 [Pancytospora philotis]|nr:hypothetical protein PAPHI01_0486 [Pancytospora philotis]
MGSQRQNLPTINFHGADASSGSDESDSGSRECEQAGNTSQRAAEHQSPRKIELRAVSTQDGADKPKKPANVPARGLKNRPANFVNLRAKSRKSLAWTKDEVNALVRGINSGGVGNWMKIIEDNRGVFHAERRVIDLVNKYRLITKTTSFHKTPKRHWVYLDENHEPAKSSGGDLLIFHDKFPFVVATKAAKLLDFHGENTRDIEIQELDNHSNAHRYRIYVRDDGLFKTKKIIPPRPRLD